MTEYINDHQYVRINFKIIEPNPLKTMKVKWSEIRKNIMHNVTAGVIDKYKQYLLGINNSQFTKLGIVLPSKIPSEGSDKSAFDYIIKNKRLV